MGKTKKNITVYLGSSVGNDPCYSQWARQLGQWIADHGYGLVYGGSRTGLMGELADGALSRGGTVIGVEPRFFMDEELQHTGLTQLIVTDDMASRKKKMLELGDVFLAFPGGIGTLEEISEVMSQHKLGRMAKPFAFLDFGGYYRPMQALLAQMTAAGFLRASWSERVPFLSDFDDLAAFLEGVEQHG